MNGEMDTLDAIVEVANSILDKSPGPVVRLRLLRDVLGFDPQSPQLREARSALEHSRWVQVLADEQRPDGSWGPFHSRDTRLRQKTLTTEMGIERAVSLGLVPSHPILQKASAYIQSLMEGKTPFPDRQEKNDRWQTGVRLFLAATLALIEPDHPAIARDLTLWLAIAQRAFQSGDYNAQDEIKAHVQLTGATVKGSYLALGGKYQLRLLGSGDGLLSDQLETALLQWLWHRQEGIGYLGVALNRPPAGGPGPVDRWFASHELLSRLFPAWQQTARPAIAWIWQQRDEHGYWDFGPSPASSCCLPFSDSWRTKTNRQFDWTARVLTLLAGSPAAAKR
jgi:hypothetical protein